MSTALLYWGQTDNPRKDTLSFTQEFCLIPNAVHIQS